MTRPKCCKIRRCVRIGIKLWTSGNVFLSYNKFSLGISSWNGDVTPKNGGATPVNKDIKSTWPTPINDGGGPSEEISADERLEDLSSRVGQIETKIDLILESVNKILASK